MFDFKQGLMNSIYVLFIVAVVVLFVMLLLWCVHTFGGYGIMIPTAIIGFLVLSLK
jgi:hypothetical protein